MMGPGKYDDLCTLVREKTGASATIVIVIGGNKGNGFSCQSDLVTTRMVPDLLEDIARQIRKDKAE